jgi:MFS family permease
MLSLSTSGAGFLMRPFGAIVLGAYADRHGRRAASLTEEGAFLHPYTRRHAR